MAANNAGYDAPLDSADYTKVTVDGLTFNVYDKGDGPAVLMFHGGPATSQEFRHNAPALVEAGFRVVAPDLLGNGDSDRPDDVSLYTMRKDYEHGLGIADALGLDTFDVVGQDRGAPPAWFLAALNPDRVRRIVSTNVGHLNGFFTAGIGQREQSWYMLFAQFDVAEEAMKADDWALFRTWMRHHPEVDSWIESLSRTPNGLLTGSLNWYRANSNPDHPSETELLPKVSAPTLVIYSGNDPYLGLEQIGTSALHLDGPLRMERIDGAGHYVSVTAPKQWNRAVLDFLQATDDEL
ncbi:alpha/beta fold hydrolase [Promicromonospora thailandica]|uniref:Pimeloyl-ACP methyl ester carboxylesterase n=1 Tax=Promicromonospora thailandica TaxID=765201 RepID=A0A9X2JTX9_9MICO|nr:alpha/beta hydrolase [Promicromonospora thailandica]MCP2263925.1 Pimeloyl-ACP methyl ester carboxylesterase [Promicromonospora thailandica]